MQELIIHPSYFPDVISLIHIHKATQLAFEVHDSYVKQTYRNRTNIAAANGKLSLNIPILHQKKGHSVPYKTIEIDHSQSWKSNHLKSIKSAYYSSPYFEYYQDELEQLYEDIPELLLDWNVKATMFLLEQLNIDKEIRNTSTYSNDSKAKQLITAKAKQTIILDPYIQVFQEKHGFLQPLSGLDLLFNLGPAAGSYLKSQHSKI
ncbi:WbqC-like protein [Nonlabens dokdonensis]|jgi:hypothetical protein|uniref:WbqC domain containing protein n=2 Tax=Nonlabens dokdonensis TaxID=328515 RepID=L7W8G0_NONDD|nr:WbqC family protein [Nonlabens dokdonensis]AGC77980.1 WbqC domain containing protein [Nonlabens dokdonensis DSW-6]PZX37051.1 WbqC-like protein [Nonlabens dokdonensis]